ncbi:CDP-glycerol glycerophosphotransferase [Nitratiruptor sp. YY08-26]|uniref:CDP-glycerol glycerophosphotransferase family protein n=1 Tax=unclassified Nitratiruptor TaxID=2624044 RepID=UPI00191644EB|nr:MULTISPECIES: CDP-glycerol glycerophosphotransferase family protein [unclassified Nitratiruptor]BCD62071.1 CDP-glycerol glycerophosphotransferase [Nitratiruptor sp. YY08-13]BCD66007.1 CDP-glycerol glycerophosphotransferase [Nitratiruptor sp. YY08-26]
MLNKIKKIVIGLVSSIYLNMNLFYYKFFKNKKIVIFRVDSYAQITHIESVFNNLKKDKNFRLFLLINPLFLNEAREKFYKYSFNSYATNLILFYDIFIGVSPVMRTPLIGKKKRICSFYCQPSKGIEYKDMNFKGYDILFFYGQYMYDFYLEEKERISKLREKNYKIFFTGQPKTDSFFKLTKEKDKSFFVEELNLNPRKKTILYAPSYEYCSSIETNGEEIIEALINTQLNIIVKPHPMIFDSNSDHHKNWYNKLIKLENQYENFLFYKDKNIDDALLACDIFLTDYSSVTFDAVAIDKKIIHWYCPKFYYEYLSKRYGIDGNLANKKLWGNVGRGIISYEVKNIDELKNAINSYLIGKDPYKEQRKELDKYLFANKGYATEKMVEKIYELLNE